MPIRFFEIDIDVDGLFVLGGDCGRSSTRNHRLEQRRQVAAALPQIVSILPLRRKCPPRRWTHAETRRSRGTFIIRRRCRLTREFEKCNDTGGEILNLEVIHSLIGAAFAAGLVDFVSPQLPNCSQLR